MACSPPLSTLRQFLATALAPERWPMQPQFQSLQELKSLRVYRKREHRHFHYRLILSLSGNYACRLNSVPLRVRAGHALLIKPGDLHSDAVAPRTHFIGVSFRIDEMDAPGVSVPVFAEGVRPAQQVFGGARRTLLPLLHAIQREALVDDDYSDWMRNAIMLLMVGQVLRLLPREVLAARFVGGVTGDSQFVPRLKRLFADRVRAQASVGELAAGMGMSASALTQKCRRHLRISPAAAFRLYRAQSALTLLRHTDQPVQAIAETLGFRNPFHFSRLMRTVYGRSPSLLRRRLCRRPVADQGHVPRPSA